MWRILRRRKRPRVSLDKGLVEARRELDQARERRLAQERRWPEVRAEAGKLQAQGAENHFAQRFREALGEHR